MPSSRRPFDMRRRPPYYPGPRPNPVVKKGRPMTIAAGFTFNPGILLCADTEQTLGEFKTTDSKIIKEQFGPQGHVAFAIAGDVSYATMAVQEIIRDLRRKSDLGHADVESTIKARVEYIYQNLLYPHPRASSVNPPFFDLIGAVWTQADGFGLLATSETAVAWTKKYACRGVGLALAEYLIKPLYSDWMSRKEVQALAAYTLSHVKGAISGCGGESEYLIVDATGAEPVSRGDKTEHEDFTELLDAYLPIVFSNAGDLDKPDEDVRDMLKVFVDALMKQRKEFREQRRKRDERIKRQLTKQGKTEAQ
jgi:20S proteasome alpha/beta subunit